MAVRTTKQDRPMACIPQPISRTPGTAPAAGMQQPDGDRCQDNPPESCMDLGTTRELILRMATTGATATSSYSAPRPVFPVCHNWLEELQLTTRSMQNQ